MDFITLSGEAQALKKVFRDFRGLSGPLGAYLFAVALLAVGTAIACIELGAGIGSPVAVTALAVVAALAEWRGRIVLRGNLTVSISLFPAVYAAVLFGPLAGMAVYSASAIGCNIPVVGRAVYVFNRGIIGASSGAVAAGVFWLLPGGPGAMVASATAAALTAELVDVALASTTWALRGHGRWWDATRDLVPVILGSAPFYGPVVAVLALAYQDVSPWTLPLFFAPALAAQRWFLMYQEQRRLAGDLQSANETLRAANLSFANGLIATLDARDRYTAGHSAAVAIYARDIAARMGLDEEQCELSHLCGLVHDIGKIGLPAGLLEKPGALTLDERRVMQSHSEIGERILANVDTYAEIAAVVRHHHERVDGQGYPDGLTSEDTPLLARIIAVADAYNAMTSDRPYRDAMPSRVARLRLAQAVESQFDTTIVAAFEAILAGATEAYRLGQGAEFDLGGAEPAPQDADELSYSALNLS